MRATELSIVLFGLPAAGKSSLLGALAQAAQAQEHLLNGRLTDVSHGLDELRQRVYDETPRRTAEEVVPYAVDYEPFTATSREAENGRHVKAVVIDCDGRVANDLLLRRQALAEDSPEGTLAHEVIAADTLVLTVDASAPPEQVEADFAEFDRFLRQLETSRGQRVEVGGLPVFLVLTKCDLLAQPGDKPSDWMERIEQRKREVDGRFRDFLARRQREAGPLPFGRIDLHLWATAIKRPALAGSPAKSREPYGVAELFRQCLEQAGEFRNRQRRSGRRLLWTVGGAAGLVALMTSLAVTFSIRNLDTQINQLRSRVEMMRFSDLPSAAERLHASARELRSRVEDLRAVQDDPHFTELPEEESQWVRDRLEEANSYLNYLSRLNQSPRLRDAHTEKELRDIKENLQTELALPHTEWNTTDAGRLHADRLQDADALITAVQRTRNWYLDRVEKADSLWTFQGQAIGPREAGINWNRWAREVETLMDSARPPFSGPAAVPGAATTMTYETTVLRYEEVVKARTDWEADRQRLRRLLDLCAALGLAPAVRDRPPALVVPDSFTLEQAAEQRKQLTKFYPNYAGDFLLNAVPEAIRPKVRQTAEENYERLLEPARALVLSRLRQAGGTEETSTRWQSVRRWLRDPKELNDWRVLATVLSRLRDPSSGDPVGALSAFLNQTTITIDIRRLTLEIPESLNIKPTIEAKFSIHHPASSGEKPALVFEQSREGERDAPRRVWTYFFRPVEGQRLSYHPGDALWATLPLRDDWMLTWVRGRSLMYQFERLQRPPRLHRSKEAAVDGTLEEKIRLIISPAEGVPRLPDLMPVVRLGKSD